MTLFYILFCTISKNLISLAPSPSLLVSKRVLDESRENQDKVKWKKRMEYDYDRCMGKSDKILLKAVKTGDIDTVEQLILEGVGINEIAAEQGERALHLASQLGDIKVVELLLKNNADPNLKTVKYGLTALYIASQYGHEQVVNLLLKYGSDPNIVDKYGWAPLHIASQRGKSRVVELLLKNKAKPNLLNQIVYPDLHFCGLRKSEISEDKERSKGLSPLHIASQYGHEQVIEVLLRYQADPTVETEYVGTCLHIASQHGHEQVVEVLLKHGLDPSIIDKYGRTPLCIASRYGQNQVVELLLRNNADPNATDSNGYTALHIAAIGKYSDIVGQLLKNKANPNAQSKEGRAPLEIAFKNRDEQSVQLLIQYGAILSRKPSPPKQRKPNLSVVGKGGRASIYVVSEDDNKMKYIEQKELMESVESASFDFQRDGRMSLYVACEKGDLKAVEQLLKGKADPNMANKDGLTPLYIASRHGHTQVVEKLLKYNANPNEADKDGLTPLYIVSQAILYNPASKEYLEIIDLLLKNQADPNMANKDGLTPLYIVSRLGYNPAVELLLKSKANPNVADKKGTTILHIASEKQDKQLIELLLEYQANTDLKEGVFEQTPLHIATNTGNNQLVKLLLEYNADPNIRDGSEWTSLHTASAFGFFQIVNQLLKHSGVDINATDGARWTPLHAASNNGESQIVDQLLKHGADVNAINDKGLKPIDMAIEQGHDEVIKILEKHTKGRSQPNMLLPGLNEQKEWDEDVDLTGITDKGTGELFEKPVETKQLFLGYLDKLKEQLVSYGFNHQEMIQAIQQVRTKVSDNDFTVDIDIQGLTQSARGSIEIGLVKNDFHVEGKQLKIEFFLSPQAKEILKDDSRRHWMQKVYEIEMMSVVNQMFLKELTEVKTESKSQEVWQQRIKSAMKAFKNKDRLPLGAQEEKSQAMIDAFILCELLPLQSFAKVKRNGLDEFLNKGIYTLYGVNDPETLKDMKEGVPKGKVQKTGWSFKETYLFLEQFRDINQNSSEMIKVFFRGVNKVQDDDINLEVNTLFKSHNVLFSA